LNVSLIPLASLTLPYVSVGEKNGVTIRRPGVNAIRHAHVDTIWPRQRQSTIMPRSGIWPKAAGAGAIGAKLVLVNIVVVDNSRVRNAALDAVNRRNLGKLDNCV
jgi:hypothetical protein